VVKKCDKLNKDDEAMALMHLLVEEISHEDELRRKLHEMSKGYRGAHREPSHAQYDLGPCVRGFEGQRYRGSHFACRGARYSQRRNNGYEMPFAANPCD